MKKTTAIILAAAASLAMCVPALSGCGGDGVKFTLSEDGTHYTVSFSGLSSGGGEYEIPSTYGVENLPVTAIAAEGFAGTRFKKIKVPATVTEIGVAAFSYCYSLETVEFAEGIQLEKFSQGMFGESINLQEIKIPDSVKTIDPLAFTGCTALLSVEMSSVETIGVRAFAGCSKLENISLPDTLITIGARAFYGAGLKSVEIPDSVHDTVTGEGEDESTVYGIGQGAFEGCVSLESVKIDGGIKVIPSAAFGACISLKEIYLPLSLKEILGIYNESKLFYGHAFYNNSSLTDIYFAGSEEEWNAIKIDFQLYSSEVNNEALKSAKKHFNNE